MKYFIFRNQTIEQFFGDKEVSYSGYDDISLIPEDTYNYIWFYQVPFNTNSELLAQEVASYIDKLRLVLSQCDRKKSFLVFSLTNLFENRLLAGDHLVAQAIDNFNVEGRALMASYPQIRWIDLEEFTEQYPANLLVNWKFYFISQTQLNPKLCKDFQKWFSHIEEEMAMKRKKCLILDLDNTLWGGILGEDGIKGIKIGGDYPGKAFLYWQQALLELSRQGVILTICSKNNETDVLEAWEKNPFMVLRQDNFSAWRINWNDKASNIQELAQELNIGLDSMVFVDDNPTERALIQQVLPEVEVPVFPEKPYELMAFFKQMVRKYFRIYSLTDEDRKKTEQYKANAQRAKAKAAFVNMDDYIRSLEIEMDIIPLDEFNISRIAQMTQKTNQFNLTTHRYAEGEVRQMATEGWTIFCLSVKDKFGENGITGTIFLKPLNNSTVEIDTLLLSCRILGKQIEFAFVTAVLNIIQSKGYSIIKAKFIPTNKNQQVADFYDKMGFKLVKEIKGEKDYELQLNKTLSINDLYNIHIK